MSNKIKVLIIAISVILAGVAGFFSYKLIIKHEFKVKTFEKEIELQYGENFDIESGNICYGNSIKCDKVEVESSGDIDSNKIGEYKITYTYTYKGKKKELTQIVKVVDKIAPEITIGEGKIDVCPNGKYGKFDYKAIDNLDGDITDKVVIKYEDKKLIVSATDSSGNTATKEIDVEPKDDKAPTIKQNGNKNVYITVGEKYEDKGATATDNCDDNIEVKTVNNVDTSKKGTYKVSYTAEDSAGNKSQLERTVVVDNVVPRQQAANIQRGARIVYLTFDDGPSYLTPQFLDILDKYNVKVTFFVTNQFPKYQYLIGEEAKRGHTVAVHTYTHAANWSMYNSLESYVSDFNKMNDVIEKQTGSKSILFRFPGGSSNTVSRSHKIGVVTEIAKYMESQGYIYFDWNVSSGDAGGTTDPNAISRNVINGVHKTGTAVVLCHDIKPATLKALPNILETLLSEGYTFLPLDESSPTAHQRIAN